jgi:hypothetical protein
LALKIKGHDIFLDLKTGKWYNGPMFFRYSCALMYLLLLTATACTAVKSTTGIIDFDSNRDGVQEAQLSSTGLVIGSGTSQANLQVQGNALITKSLSIGTTTQSSNLNVGGSLAMSYGVLSSNASLDHHSIYLAGNATDNIILNLPSLAYTDHRRVTVKKTLTGGEVWLSGNGAPIDGHPALILSASSLSSVSLDYHQGNWYRTYSSGIQDDISTDNLILRVAFDEGSGNTFTSNNGTGMTVTRTGYTSSGNGWVQGVSGNGMAFDAIGNEVTVPHDARFVEGGDFTISTWVNTSTLPSETGNSHTFIKKHHSDTPWTSLNMMIEDNGGDRFKVVIVDSASVYHNTPGPVGVQKNRWYHVVMVLRSNILQLYIDGQFSSEKASALTLPIYSSDREFRIGYQSSTSRFFKGKMDEFRYYNKALSNSEIYFLYKSGNPN